MASTGTALSVVIVAYNSAADLARTLPALVGQLDSGGGDELIVVDNGSTDATATIVAEHGGSARLHRMGRNSGFAAAANAGAGLAGGDVILILNPDARPLEGFLEAMRRPRAECPDWSAWMGLVSFTERGERLVNSAGNPVHFTGIVWAGGHGRELGTAGTRRQVTTASGACMAVRAEAWRALGGFAEPFFLYHEDVDLSIRLRLAGGLIGIEPGAVVDHDYSFDANPDKWRWLERNRWSFLIRTYPGAVLALAMPAILAAELALVAVSARQGWLGQKLRAWGEVLRWLPRLVGERRRIQAGRRITPAEFAGLLAVELDSPFIPGLARGRLAGALLRAYWSTARRLLGPALQ